MTRYDVHIYREMRLTFTSINAESPEEAAEMARELSSEAAQDIDECDGETFASLVDVQGDTDFSQSRTIDFDGERMRKAAPYMLATLQRAEFLMRRVVKGDHQALRHLPDGAAQCRDAIIKATKKGANP